MVKAYSYIRFSTPEQIKGDSLRRQAEASVAYALEHGLDLDTSLNLKDFGISAYDQSNLKKGALGIFVNLIEKGKIKPGSYLLVESLDRLSRGQVTLAVELFINIINSGIKIVTLMDNQIYSSETINANMSNLLMSIVIMSRAYEESVTKSKRIRASWDRKRNLIEEKRLTKRCPYWLKPSEDTKGFDFIPERVEIVRRIFQMAKNGMGNSIITKRLNQENIKPFSEKTDGWQPTYIQKLLTNPAVYGDINLATQRDGEIKPYGEPIKNYYPALMTKEEWALINQRRLERTTKGGANKGAQLTNLFSGILFCGHCNGPLTMGAHSKKLPDSTRRIRKYIGCSRGRRGLGCKHLTWGYDDLENEIIRFCRSIDFAEVLGKKTNFKMESEEALQYSLRLKDKINENKLRLNKLIEFVEENNEVELSTVRERITNLENENNNLAIDMLNAESLANKLALKNKENTNYQDVIVETLDQLRTMSGNNLHDLRLKLSSEVKHCISKIFVYPGGFWKPEAEQNALKISLINSGISEEDVSEYLKLSESPNRENKYIVVVFKNNEVIRLSKNEVMHNFKVFAKDEYLNS